MIEVTISQRDNVPVRIVSTGHAVVGENGESAPCAAVSTLLQAFGLILVDSGCVVHGVVDQPGSFDMTIGDCDDPRWYRGVADVTIAALQAVQRSWPGQIHVVINEE